MVVCKLCEVVMRLKEYGGEKDGKRVWLSEQEVQRLLDAGRSDHREERAALLLAARCGLRREEITDVTPADLVDNETGRVVRVWHGKGDKYREVPCPDELVTLALGMDHAPSESLVDVNESTIYRWVQNAAKALHAETGDKGWLFVGPHDLRRSWGVRLLEGGVIPSLVMEWGGWEDWDTFRNHYLAEFSPEAIKQERTKVSWLEGNNDDEVVTSYTALESMSGGKH